MNELLVLFFWLLAGHALVDFSLQTEAMASGKNRHRTPSNVPSGQTLTPCWPYWLTAHALEHGACVTFVTGSVILGVMETGFHWVIDFAKCENHLGVHSDQICHLLCKLTWLVLWRMAV